MTNIRQWLSSLNLEQYLDAFEENAIEWSTLPKLNHELLKEIGVSAVGHRVKMLEAINNHSFEADVAPDPADDHGREGIDTAERRQLTVMFCDLVGSTELSRQLDPEELREINLRYQDTAKVAIERYEGYIARYMGDGVLAYFGYPRAHEDDTERSIRAGLGLVEAVENLNENMATDQSIKLAVRVGIATGQVVVGDIVGEGASQESAVIGETPNLAARLQGIASPNSVVVASSTHDLEVSRFQYEDLGDHTVKGIEELVHAWRVVAPVAVEGRFEAVHRSRMTSLVGRDQEIDLLLKLWETVKEGTGQLLLLSGEAGIGKSRIMQEFRESLAREPHVRMRYQCSPFHTSSTLYPVTQQLGFAAQLAMDDTVEERLDKVQHMLAEVKAPDAETLSVVAELMSIPTGERYPTIHLTPQAKKDRTLTTLIEQLEGHAARQPIFMIFEDVQWIDPTTSELIDLTADAVRNLPVLVLITFRPEYNCSWSGYPHATTLALNRLTRAQTESVIQHVADEVPLPDDVVDQIVAKTDGVPLFIEELTKNVLESGALTHASDRYELAGPLVPLAIPASLQDSLMARLDRMASVKELAQIGAAIGREFSYDLISSITGVQDAELHEALDRLVKSELVFRRGMPPSATYTFKHALVQDAAYASLLKSRRQQLHTDIAKAITMQRPDLVETQPELLAHHYAYAGLPESAIEHWQMAATRAIGRSAYLEAIEQLDKALEQVGLLPNGQARDKLELELHVTKLGPTFPVKGYASPEAFETSARALELARTLGDNRSFFPALFGRWTRQFITSNQKELLGLSQECLERANEADYDAGRVLGHRMLAVTWFFRGEMESSRFHADQAVQLYRPEAHISLVARFGQDLKIQSMIYVALSDALLGNIDEALAIGAEVITHARNLNHANALAFALWYIGVWLNSIVRDTESAQRFGIEMLEVARTYRLVFWEAIGLPHIAVNRHGKTNTEAASDGQKAIDIWRREHTANIFVPEILCRIAEAHLDNGDSSIAGQTLSEAATKMDESGEIYWQSELYRLRGRMEEMITPDEPQAAIAAYERAIAIARERNTKLLELRAATGLAQLLIKHHEYARAKQMLAPVHEWFTGGFDKPDLVEAGVVLQVLD